MHPAHDLGTGGLAQSLVDAALRFGVGARVDLTDLCERDGVDLATALFSESGARALVSVPRSEEVRFVDACVARSFPVLRIGQTDDEDLDGGQALLVEGVGTLPLAELRATSEDTLPRYFA